ncbi:MAG TPA: winged helix-turn-helix transcriptional regulator [Polyangiaceae bacterium]|nr:winged helix-turn-helix transcriptional regulator [Polyangiaceae bacterium]
MKRRPKRSYGQFCSLARALDRLGERWTLLIVRNLLLGPRRYSELLSELPGITTNLLAERLKGMQSSGLIARRALSASDRSSVYELTALGAALEPAIMELGRWGGRFMDAPKKDDTVNIGWGLLSLKRRYRGGHSLVAGFRIGERHFELAFSPAYLAVAERAAVRPDVSVSGELAAFQDWLFRQGSASKLRRSGRLNVEGDARAWKRVISALLPPPVARAA